MPIHNAFDPEQTARIALTYVPGFGPRTLKRLFQLEATYAGVFRGGSIPANLPGGVQSALLRAARENVLSERWKQAESSQQRARAYGARPLLLGHPEYPTWLAEIPDPPPLLWCMGDPLALQRELIAVVGTRRRTNYGVTATQQVVSQLARLGLGIVSGLAYGIDIVAHKACVAEGACGVVVLGSGLDVVYPSAHLPVVRQLLERGGCVLSEFDFGTKPHRQNFPTRNRIISGLSRVVVLIEAFRDGGAVHTARMALEHNRDVWAVPGGWDYPASEGCNRLIADGEARLLAAPDDIPALLGRAPSPKAVQLDVLSPDLERVWQSLAAHPKSLDVLVSETGLTTTEVLVHLSRLELLGRVHQGPAADYRRRDGL